MDKDIKTKNSKIVKRSYLARDFDGFKKNLIEHARTFFPNNIEDFTEAGLGGMFVDMISYVGDSLSYYLDHQFNELKWSESVEIDNIKKHLELNGVQSSGASPASVMVRFYVVVPTSDTNSAGVDPLYLPVIKEGTQMISENGITFTLMEDVDFSSVDSRDNNRYFWESSIPAPIEENNGNYKNINLPGLCVSGENIVETFSIPDTFVPFREITLSNQNVSLIDSVQDSDGNVYYEVDNLSQDNVFILRDQKDLSGSQNEKILGVQPAPYRYTKSFDPQTLTTSLIFGGGDAEANDDDILPDPADLSIPLYGKKTFSSFSLDPNSLLKTNTLGVAPRATTVSIKYKYGGGFSHNVNSKSIREITFLDLVFKTSENLNHEQTIKVRSSLAVRNDAPAAGGSPAPTLEELRNLIPSAKNSQKRVVTKEDLLSRIYSIPAPLGRVFRASIAEAPDSNGVIEVALVSRDSRGNLVSFGSMDTTTRDLTITPDNMKLNLKKYLESFRLINDSYILLDAIIHNFGIEVDVVSTPGAQKSDVASSIINNLKKILDVRLFQINQPISLGDIYHAVINAQGVSSINDVNGIRVVSLTGESSDGNKSFRYSSFGFRNTPKRGFIFPRKNGIFELKYPEFDIKVNVR